jgi:hypothetical protein
VLILAAFLALAAPEAAAAAPAPTQAAGAKDEKQICITKAKVGTRFKERVCFDKAEYERRQLEERKALERMQKIPYQGS